MTKARVTRFGRWPPTAHFGARSFWALSLLATAAPFREVIQGRRSAIYGDVYDVHLPFTVFAWRAIVRGRSPWILQNVFGGHSLAGSGQAGLFYPVNAIFGIMSPAIAHRYWLLLHIWVAMTGAFLWSKQRWESAPGAAVTGVSYALSGFLVLHLVHMPLIVAAAWLPWPFFGFELLKQRWSPIGVGASVVGVAAVSASGHPQLMWILAAGLGFLILFDRDDRWRGSFRRVCATGLGFGLGAVAILPLWLYSRTSVRPEVGKTEAFATRLPARNLLTLVYPYLYGGHTVGSVDAPFASGGPYHEIAIAIGTTATMFALVAILLRWRDRDVWVIVALVVATMVVALGGSTPLGDLVFRFVPGARLFRIWPRYGVASGLAIAVLAGAGVREALERPRTTGKALAGLAAVIGLGGLWLPHYASFATKIPSGPYGLIARGAPLLVAVALVGAVSLWTENRTAGGLFLLLICAIEAHAFAASAEWSNISIPENSVAELFDRATPPVFGTPFAAEGGVDRWATNTYVFRNLSAGKGIFGINTYDALLDKEAVASFGDMTYDGIIQTDDLWSGGWTADTLRVSTILIDHGFQLGPPWKYDGEVVGFNLDRWVTQPRLAEAYVVSDLIVAPHTSIRLRMKETATDLRLAAFVESGVPEVDTNDAQNAPLSGAIGGVISSDVVGSGRVVVDARRSALVVMSQTWIPGWSATVDGRPARLVRANGMTVGVPVTAGRHEVRLSFRPPGVAVGAIMAISSALITLASLLATARFSRRTARLPSSAGAEQGPEPLVDGLGLQ